MKIGPCEGMLNCTMLKMTFQELIKLVKIFLEEMLHSQKQNNIELRHLRRRNLRSFIFNLISWGET